MATSSGPLDPYIYAFGTAALRLPVPHKAPVAASESYADLCDGPPITQSTAYSDVTVSYPWC